MTDRSEPTGPTTEQPDTGAPSEGVEASPSRWSLLLRRFRRHSLVQSFWVRAWLVTLAAFFAGAALLVVGVLLGLDLLVPLGLLAMVLSLVGFFVIVAGWLLGKLLWRVSRRLLVSYVLVGVVPALLIALVSMGVLWLAAAQLAALRVESAVMERARELQGVALGLLPRSLIESDQQELSELVSGFADESALAGLAFKVGDTVGGSGPIPPEALVAELEPEAATLAIGKLQEDHLLIAMVPRSDGLVVVYERLEPELRRRLELTTKIGLFLPAANEGSIGVNVTYGRNRGVRSTITSESDDEAEDAALSDGEDAAGDGDSRTADAGRTESGTDESPSDAEDDESVDAFGDSAVPFTEKGLWQGPYVFWAHSVDLPYLDLPSLEEIELDSSEDMGFPILIRSSLANELRALFRQSERESFNQVVGSVAQAVALGMLWTVAAVCLLLAAIAAFLVFRVARATSQLYVGFQEVENGNFEHRARLRGKDQLASLVDGFNRMVESLGTAIEERAAREALERELDLARELQQRMLPATTVRRGNLEIAVDFEPAAAIGGDFYDFIGGSNGNGDSDGALDIVVGDVSGHGLATGIVMASASSLLRAQAGSHRDPAPLLAAVDRQLHDITDRRTFVTLVYARLDPAAGRAVVANAGHIHPYRVARDGSVSAVEGSQRPLGLGLPAEFVSVEGTVAAGDLWVFLSDGLIEALSPAGEAYGFERLEATLGECVDLAPAAARELMLERWRAFTAGRKNEDDRTLIVVGVGAAPIVQPPTTG